MIKVATYSDTCKSIEQHLVCEKQPDLDILVRMGGTLPYSKYPVQINSKIGTEISIDKHIFSKIILKSVPTEFIFNELNISDELLKQTLNYAVNHAVIRNIHSVPLIAKPVSKSGGDGIEIIEYFGLNKEFKQGLINILNKIGPYILQPMLSSTSEYRVHVCTATNGYKVTKKVKNNPDDLFVTRDNHKVIAIENTVKPRLFNDMVLTCLENAKIMGMDIICFDVLYDSKFKDDEHEFFIIESNTGPELIGSTKEWYINQINNLIKIKTA